MNLKFDTLKQALSTLEDAIRLYREKQEDRILAMVLRDAVIQRFEYTYELAWRTIQRWIYLNASPELTEPAYSRKELFRIAARYGLIDDPARWFGYHEARNVSVHTYNESNAETAFQAAMDFIDDVNKLISKLEKQND